MDKKCYKCGKWKPLTDFHKCKTRYDGRSSQCKDCRRLYYKANRAKFLSQAKENREANKEERVEKDKIYYVRDKVARRVQQKIYRETHKEETKVRNLLNYEKRKEERKRAAKLYYKENKSAVKAQYQEYRKTDSWKVAMQKSSAKRRAQKKNCGYEDFKPREVFERDGYVCQMCGRKTRPSFNCFHSLYPNLDHIVPLSEGGEHSRLNTQCLCHQCNLEKWATGKGDQLRMFG